MEDLCGGFEFCLVERGGSGGFEFCLEEGDGSGGSVFVREISSPVDCCIIFIPISSHYITKKTDSA